MCTLTFHWEPLRRLQLHLPSLSQLNTPSSQTLLTHKYVSPFSSLIALHWAHSLALCLSCTGEPRTGHSTPGVTSPVPRGRRLPQTPLTPFDSGECCWFRFHLKPTRTFHTFSTKLFPAVCHSMYRYVASFFPNVGDSHRIVCLGRDL